MPRFADAGQYKRVLKLSLLHSWDLFGFLIPSTLLCSMPFSFTLFCTMSPCLHLQGTRWCEWVAPPVCSGLAGRQRAAQRRNLLATYPTRVLHATNHRQIRPITTLRPFSTNERPPPALGCAQRHLPTYPRPHTWLHCTTLGSCKHHMSFIKLYSGRFLAAWYYKFFQATAVRQPSPHHH